MTSRRVRSRFLGLVALVCALLVPATRAVADLVSVPDVVGRPRAEAIAAVQAHGFLVAVYEVAGTPPDTVAAESPVAGTSLPRGATVILEVRRAESDSTTAPNAVGLTPSAATSALGSLFVLRFEAADGAEGDRGKVVAQTPAAGQAMELRGTLTLRFVRDPTVPARVPLPSVMGLPTAEAVQALGDAGLLARVARATVPGAPADTVVSQWPFPGTEIERYATVDVIASELAATEPGAGTPLSVTVPNVVGLSESSARAALSDAGLGADVEWIDGPAASAFLVDSQDPASGAEATSDTVVRLRIVRYAPPPTPTPPTPPGGVASMVAVPSLIGMSQWQAEDLLASLGLWADPVLLSTSSVPALRVFSQLLAPGSWVAPGTSVTFRVAKPPPPPTAAPVPNFFGRTKAASLALAALAGLSLNPIDVVNPARPPHRVYSQDVAAYSIVPLGTTITVRIARPSPGPATATVPDLLGKTEGQASALLAAAGLAGSPTWVFAPGHPLLRVYQQNPSAGTSVPVGFSVSYRISRPLLGTLVPDLLGRTRVEAIAIVSGAGFSPMPHDVFAPGHPFGRVFAQNPTSGTLRAPGSTVTFEVATSPTHIVPNVEGKTQADAVAALTAAGFGHTVAIVPAIGRPPGRVWDQSPEGGALGVSGANVQLRLQPGLPNAPVPDVFGKTQLQAHGILTSAGFVPNMTIVVAPLRPPGRAFDQSPNAGIVATLGTSVQVKIAAGIGPIGVLVPNLDGLTLTQAQSALAAAGLGSDPIDANVLGHPLGRVFTQSPLAGASVSPGTVVHYKIATLAITPILTTVPNVIGRTAHQAQLDIEAAGLVSDGSTVLNLLKPPHRVYSQNVSPGTLVARGSVVKWKANP